MPTKHGAWRDGARLGTLVGALLIACVGCDPPARSERAPGDAPREPVAGVDAADGNARGRAAPVAPDRASAAPIATAPVVRVGAWNIEWLGVPENRSGPARNKAQKAEDLADYILASEVSILGLAEIAISNPGAGDTNDVLTAAFEIIGRKTGQQWTHELYPARSGRNQLIGLAWDAKRIAAVGDAKPATMPGDPGPGGEPLWSRPPYGRMFSAGRGLTDFVVIMIHMKSNYDGDHSEHRAAEARTLVRDLSGAFADPDVIIIGDSNTPRHTQPAISTIESAGWVDLNARDEATFWTGGALDRVFLPKTQPEFAARVFHVLRDDYLKSVNLTPREFKIRYSDHYMVITSVAVAADDD
ncbi:MAG: hypothetical protein AB7Q17_02825 [Phycisphaerae bacterium]